MRTEEGEEARKKEEKKGESSVRHMKKKKKNTSKIFRNIQECNKTTTIWAETNTDYTEDK